MARGQRRETREAHRNRQTFFEEGRRLNADPDTCTEAACWLCRGDIDYTVGQGTTPDSHTRDHYHPVDDRPDLQEDPANWRHAHYSCNSSRGKRTPTAGLGDPMPAWW